MADFQILKDLENNKKSMWQALQFEKEFSDVTLACDNEEIMVHKFVLNSSSSLFQDIFKQDSNQHIIIYITGISRVDLQHLVQFIYQGEVNIAKDDMNNFIKVSEDLKIKGLSGLFPKRNRLKDNFSGVDITRTSEENKFDLKIMNDENSSNQVEEQNLNYYKDKDDQLVKQEELEINAQKQKQNIFYECDICNHKTLYKGNLKKHIQEIHECVVYPCDQCTYQGIQKSHLKRHKQSIHDGIRYPCDECTYRATDRGHLKKHKQATHEEILYPCDTCEYKTGYKGHLSRHIRTVHLNGYNF